MLILATLVGGIVAGTADLALLFSGNVWHAVVALPALVLLVIVSRRHVMGGHSETRGRERGGT